MLCLFVPESDVRGCKMPRQRTKFNVKWLDEVDTKGNAARTWLKQEGLYAGRCYICAKIIACDGSGLAQIQSHANGAKHKELMKQFYSTSQLRLQAETVSCKGSSTSGDPPLLATQIVKKWTHADRVTKAEILWAMKVASAGYSYESTCNISKLFNEMFNDSNTNPVVSDFELASSKMSYVISHGLGPFFHSEVVAGVLNSNMPYTLHIDDTTTAQVKKQLDLHVRYWSDKGVAVRYLTSLFLGHATADIMCDRIEEALKLDNLPLSRLLQVSSDGPAVNKLLIEKLNKSCKEAGSPGLVDIGPCNLHVVHNAFAAGLKSVEQWEIEEFLLDIYHWFKYSAPRREDYADLQKLLELDERAFQRYVSSRWLTLLNVVGRVIEQYDGLYEYFVKVLPQKEPRTCSGNSRYQRIVKHLKTKVTLIRLTFIKSVGVIFNDFLVVFQKEGPLIHLLYSELTGMLKKLLNRFVKYDVTSNLLGSELTKVDVKLASNWLPEEELRLGVETKGLLRNSKTCIKDGERKALCLDVRAFYQRVSVYLQEHLPLDNVLLKNLQCLNPLKRDICTERSILFLAEKLKQAGISGVLLDRLSDEWTAYASDLNISEDMYISSRSEDNTGSLRIVYRGVDEYWKDVSQLVSSSGEPKFEILFKVFHCYFSESPYRKKPKKNKITLL